MFVRASVGSTLPSVVVKVMTVPFCTGVPAPDDEVAVGVGVVGVSGVVGVVGVVGGAAVVPFSIAVATISISPFTGTEFAVAKSEITVPPGARSGTLSHAESTNAGSTAAVERQRRFAQADEKDCASMEKPDVFEVMSLRDLRRHDGERGYAMAALLVALAILAILLSVAMPVWRHEAQREKEAELVFRGEQYARAVALFRFKNANVANAFPPSIDSLVEGRYLRKKYKDPMTKDGEFVLIGVGSAQPGINPPPAQPGGRGGSPTPPAGQQVAGGMTGVRSKSEENSIRSYRGATRYDQWQFTFNIAPRPGGAMPMANSPDGRGNTPPGANFPGSVLPGGRRGGGPGGRPTGPGGRPTGPGGRGPGGVGPGGEGGTQPPFVEPGSGNRGVGPGPSGRGRGF